MSYEVRKIKNEYDIYEHESKTSIKLKTTKPKDIYAISRKLNLGSGFCGWTPEFFADGG